MRLTFMYHIIRKNYDEIEKMEFKVVTEKDPANRDRQVGVVSSWLNTRKSLLQLKNIGCFNEIINDILDTIKEKSIEADTIRLSVQDYNFIKDKVGQMIDQMEGVISFCNVAGFNERQSGFDVKLPPTKDFSEMSKYIDSLNRVLTQCPYFNVENEKIEIETVDIGSIWMKFAVVATSTAVILSNLATVTDKCVKIQSHIITCRQQEENYRTLNLKNDLLEQLIKANEEATNALIDQASKDLQNDIEKLSPEDEARLKMTLKELSNMMSKGLEIYASIDAPEEVKDLFPTTDEIKALNEPQKLLTEGKDEE